MSWNTLDPRIREIAARELTPCQLDVFKLKIAGLGYKRISVMLTPERDPTTVRQHFDAANRTLRRHGVGRRTDGIYYLEETARA